MKKIRHVLGISGGKDSAALAVYMQNKYPQLNMEYYFCDTGKELDETYQLIESLELFLGKEIKKLRANIPEEITPFDFFYDFYGGYLPSKNARWCTRKMKLEPFEQYVSEDPVISYVGIRGDEERDGYISRKPNILSIFPFRKNIWSEDIINLLLQNINISLLGDLYKKIAGSDIVSHHATQIIRNKISPKYLPKQKLNDLLALNVVYFNRLVFEFLKNGRHPLALLEDYPLLTNDEELTIKDIYKILDESGVGIPKYYKDIEFRQGGKLSYYSRTRSGCFFCFFQRKIEWVWLYEQHPHLYKEAMKYEKSGFTWSEKESLKELKEPKRVAKIKEDHMKKCTDPRVKSPYLLDILAATDDDGCSVCFL